MPTLILDSYTKSVLRKLEWEAEDHGDLAMAQIANKARTTGDEESFRACFKTMLIAGSIENHWGLHYVENDTKAKPVDLDITSKVYRDLILDSILSDRGYVQTPKGDVVYAGHP